MTIVLDERSLNFDFDKSNVKPEYYDLLNNIKKFVEQNNYEITIVGHTDSIGSNAYNLIQNGITKGYNTDYHGFFSRRRRRAGR